MRSLGRISIGSASTAMRKELVDALLAATNTPGVSLAPAALVIARIEYPRLDEQRYVGMLDAMGNAARCAIERHVAATGDTSTGAAVRAVNQYLFEELGFVGNREHYEDPRNSCLNEVLDHRTGIPITLCVVYLEVARRAGVTASGI